MLRRDAGVFIRDPQKVYHQLCKGLNDKHLTLPELCKVSTGSDLAHELGLSGKSLESYPESFLGNFEKQNKKKYEDLLGEESLELQAFCVNQNPDYVSKLKKTGLLPTFTKSDKVIWLPGLKRHLLALEKYAGHGFGVTESLAALNKTPVFNVAALSNPHPMLGNGQHIGVSALVLAAALFSVQLWEDPEPRKPLTLETALSEREQAGWMNCSFVTLVHLKQLVSPNSSVHA
ncbi:unnamed protein product [Durusdinium trenchii]|uniref:Uncharacterized protein n=1 Tax=Durusdinium trenchii TaxID=1381693 RepID=A0ABP0MSH7_9DINO